MPKWDKFLAGDRLIERRTEVRDSTTIVIATEGRRTEKDYFNKFGSTQIKLEILETGKDGLSDPKYVLDRLVDRLKLDDIDIAAGDSCWIVIDVDDRTNEHLAQICERASEMGFGVAISNPCFEYWLYLHQFEPKELPSMVYDADQEKRAGAMKGLPPYEYRRLRFVEFRKDVNSAIARAKQNRQGGQSCIPKCPGTDVFKLVRMLPVKPPGY